MLYCAFCGKRIFEKSSFCSGCGQKVIRIEEQDIKATETLAPEKEIVKTVITPKTIEETTPVLENAPAKEIIEPLDIRTPEQVPVSRPDKKVVPAIFSKVKDINKYLIEIDGKRIDVVADLGKKPKIDLFVEGELPETIDKQDSEVTFEFEGITNKHKIDIWFSLAPSSMLNVRYKEAGVSIKIDGVPVKNSLADPVVGIKGGIAGLILFTIALGIKVISSIVQSTNGSVSIYAAVVYIVLVSIMITFSLMLKSKPKFALYGGLAVGLLESVEYVAGTILSFKDSFGTYSSGSNTSGLLVGFFIWGSMRIWALSSIWKSTRALKRL